MYYIQWDMIHLVYLLNNMLFKLVTIHLDLLAEEKGLRKNGSRLLAN